MTNANITVLLHNLHHRDPTRAPQLTYKSDWFSAFFRTFSSKCYAYFRIVVLSLFHCRSMSVARWPFASFISFK